MLRTATLVCAMLTWASTASGRASDAREAQARKDCLTGKVESGVALLADLFIETKNPNFIYNQARCYEQNGRANDAIQRFREYLRVAENLSTVEQAEVEKHIADCRSIQTEDGSTPTTSQPSPLSAESAPPSPGQATTAPTMLTAESVQPGTERPSDGSRLRLAGMVAASAGLAGLLTGGVFSYLVSSAKQQAEDNAKNGTYDADLQSRGESYETLQWVAYGAGAGLLVTGGILYYFGHAAGAQSTVALVPEVAPARAGLVLKGRF